MGYLDATLANLQNWTTSLVWSCRRVGMLWSQCCWPKRCGSRTKVDPRCHSWRNSQSKACHSSQRWLRLRNRLDIGFLGSRIIHGSSSFFWGVGDVRSDSGLDPFQAQPEDVAMLCYWGKSGKWPLQLLDGHEHTRVLIINRLFQIQNRLRDIKHQAPGQFDSTISVSIIQTSITQP